MPQETFFEMVQAALQNENEVIQPSRFQLRLLEAYIEAHDACASFANNVNVPDEFAAMLNNVVRRGKEPA